MILECYFDCANKPTGEHDRVVLATVCGTREQWKGFNADWNAVRDAHGAPPLHTTDAASLSKRFRREHGWNETRVDDFITDAVKVIRKHLGILSPELGLHVTTLTIMVEDYRRARAEVPLLTRNINDLCLSESLRFCFEWGRKIGAEQFDLHFDRGEPFRGYAINRATNRQAKRDAPYLGKITVFPPDSSNLTPALQMADLFAWCISHNGNVTRFWHRVLHCREDDRWESKLLRYEDMLNPIPGVLERIAKWKMPRPQTLPVERVPVVPYY